jgi:hypothetical protein
MSCTYNYPKYLRRLKSMTCCGDVEIRVEERWIDGHEFDVILDPVIIPLKADPPLAVDLELERGNVANNRYSVDRFTYSIYAGSKSPSFRFENDHHGAAGHAHDANGAHHSADKGNMLLDIHNLTGCLVIAVALEYWRTTLSPLSPIHAAGYMTLIAAERGRSM